MPSSEDPASWDDAELARRAAAREEKAWTELFRRCGPSARGMMRKVFLRAGAPDPAHEAEEALGSLALSLLERGGRVLLAYRPPAPLGFYLSLIARREAFRILRKRKRSVSLDKAEEIPAPLPEVPPATPEEIRSALDALPSRDRLALRLCYWKGMRQEDIAPVLGVQPSSMGALMTRARSALREALERKSEESRPDFPSRRGI